MPFDFAALHRDIDVLIDETLSADAQKTLFVAVAADEVEAFEQAWGEALNRLSFRSDIFVDGRKGAAIEEVQWPGGVILAYSKPMADMVNRTLTLLNAMVKVKSGRLKRSIAAYANQRRIQKGEEALGDETVVITYLAPYARKAERLGFNKTGGRGGAGLLETVAKTVTKEFRGAPGYASFNFKNFAEAEITERNVQGIGYKGRKRGVVRRRDPEPSRLPMIEIG
ncbi:MAG: hypothetical protein AB7P23_01805 [Amphiplicatus sp.]